MRKIQIKGDGSGVEILLPPAESEGRMTIEEFKRLIDDLQELREIGDYHFDYEWPLEKK